MLLKCFSMMMEFVHVTNKIPYIIIFFLSLIAPEGYKIMISYSEDYIHEVEYKIMG